MAIGSGSRPVDEVRQQMWREHVASLRDIELEELRPHFSLEVLGVIDAYQTIPERPDAPEAQATHHQLVDHLAHTPFPGRVSRAYKENPGLLGLLACNTAMFDDELEDRIDEDPLIKGLTEASQGRAHGDGLYAAAQRIRRSILALALTAPDEHTTNQDQPPPENTTTAA